MSQSKKTYSSPQVASLDDVQPLTREEIQNWPPMGPMSLDPLRVLALIIERDALRKRLKNYEVKPWSPPEGIHS